MTDWTRPNAYSDEAEQRRVREVERLAQKMPPLSQEEMGRIFSRMHTLGRLGIYK